MEEVLDIKLTRSVGTTYMDEFFNSLDDREDSDEVFDAFVNAASSRPAANSIPSDVDHDEYYETSSHPDDSSEANAGDASSSSSSPSSKKKEKWYPGKFAKKLVEKAKNHHPPQSLFPGRSSSITDSTESNVAPPATQQQERRTSTASASASVRNESGSVTQNTDQNSSAAQLSEKEHDHWYPGKYANMFIRHRQEVKRAKTLKLAEEKEEKKLEQLSHNPSKGSDDKLKIQVKQADRPVFAQVTVKNIIARNLHGWARRNCYCYVALEDNRVQTNLLHKYTVDAQTGTKLWKWPEEIKFDITDINSDLRICLYCSIPLTGKDFCVGTVIIPLANVIPYLEMKASFKAWLEIYPLPPNELFYTPVVVGMPGAAGLDRPAVSLGQIYVEMNIKLYDSDLLALLLTSPFRNIHPKIPDNVDPQYIKGGMNRIVVALNPPHFLFILLDLIAWKSPFASTLALLIWSHLTLICPVWLYPFMFSIIVCGFGLASRGTQDRSHIFPFNERSGNALNWSDERLSAAFSIFILALGLVFSLVILAWSILTYFIPARRIFFAAGFLVLLPPNHLVKNKVYDILAKFSRKRKLTDLPAGKDLEDKDDDQPLDLTNKKKEKEDGKFATAPVVPEADPSSNEEPTIPIMIRNLMSRIPDEREIAHRIIAKSQIVEIVE